MRDFRHSYNYKDKEDLTYIDRVNTTKLFGKSEKGNKANRMQDVYQTVRLMSVPELVGGTKYHFGWKSRFGMVSRTMRIARRYQ